MTHRETIQEIRKMISEEDLLCQLAEECTELAKAALKLRRAITKTNPTPVTYNQALEDLMEEVTDVILCLRVLPEAEENGYIIDIGTIEKAERWLSRLREVQA
jgi:hypothetical protein